MSKPANNVAIGAFVVGGLLILMALLFSLSGSLFQRNTVTGLVIFDGSVKGLKVGAPVAFKGVQIGEVTSVDVVVESDTFEVITPVVMRINRDRIRRTDQGEGGYMDINVLIERGLRAQLQTQSLLTGLLYVQLDFHPGTEPRYAADDLSKYQIDDEILIVPTIPTDLERLAEGLEEIDILGLLATANSVVSGIDTIVNDPALQALPGELSATLGSLQTVTNRLDQQIATLSPSLVSLVENTDGAVEALNRDLPEMSRDMQEALVTLNETLGATQQAMQGVAYVLSDDSAVLYDVREAARELGRAGRSLQSLAESLETQPEAIIRGRQGE
ncbi:MAG: MlaD family protein [Halieaceae bacterium]|jgi:paraquat-inducible protein B|nr:MlaD family protein [Halieaceae bacterium]